MPDAPQPRTISVTGTGRVAVVPDLADLRLGVTVTARTVESARAANATAMAGIIGSLTASGVADRDIRTTNLSLSPAYDYSSNRNPPRVTGYTLSNVVEVRLRDLATVGGAIDGALGAGATSLDSITFGVRDPSAAERRARQDAVADARTKADVLAAAAGVAITGVAAISESGAEAPAPMFRAEMARQAKADVSTPVEAGTNEIAITVAVTYLIG